MRDASLSASRLQPLPDERATQKRRNAARPPARTRPSVLARVFSPRRMGVLLVLGIGGLAAVGVPMNALFFQDGRHPAPLFSARPPAADKNDVAAKPTPPARPSDIAARVESEPVKAEPTRAPAKTERARPEPARTETNRTDIGKSAGAEKKRDPIGQLLSGGAATTDGPDKNVLAAQKALLKLGYVLRADGVLGGGTRRAIEKFERDNGLPAKGELTPKIMRQITARSGVARQ